MIELAGYSSWYPQFVFGEPLQAELALSQYWTSVCSGKKLEDHVQEDRALTLWSSPKDMGILILASPKCKEKSIQKSGVNLQIYYTQLPEEFIAQEGAEIAAVLKFYSTRLRETNFPGATILRK